MNPFWTSDAKLLFGIILLLVFAIVWLMRVRLYKLLIKSFIGPFIGTFFVALFLFLMQTIWKYLEDLVGKGLELSVIFEFIFYFAIHLIPMALPLAILLSSIMVFGNLAEIAEQHLEKGKEVCIEGKLNNRTYDDKDGNKRYVTEIVVQELLMLGKKQ